MGTLANISSGSTLFLLRLKQPPGTEISYNLDESVCDLLLYCYVWENPAEYKVKKVSEYDQEILQSQTVDQPTTL